MKRTPGLLEVSERAYAMPQEGEAVRRDGAAAVSFVLGPVLFAFLCWVIRRAGQLGWRRLYFLSRDGYLMCEMARRICRKRNIPIECRYLYASRFAWRIPEQDLAGEKAFLDRICRNGMEVSFSGLMKRAGLTEEEGRRIAALLRPQKGYDGVLSGKEIRALRLPLAECMEFRRLASLHAGRTHANAVAYLKQEGLLEEVPYGIVDSGWIGSMQESLNNLLHSAGKREGVQGCYFGLYDLPKGAKEEDYHAFYFSPGLGIGKKARFSNCLFECVFTAPQGMTIGYENNGIRMIPKRTERAEEDRRRIEEMRDWFFSYMDAMEELWEERLWAEGEKLDVFPLLKSLMSAPSREESLFFGSLFFSDDTTEERMRPLVARLSQGQLFAQHLIPRILLETLGKTRKESGWMEGSVRLYGGRLYAWHRAETLFYKYLLYAGMQGRYRKRRKAV